MRSPDDYLLVADRPAGLPPLAEAVAARVLRTDLAQPGFALIDLRGQPEPRCATAPPR